MTFCETKSAPFLVSPQTVCDPLAPLITEGLPRHVPEKQTSPLKRAFLIKPSYSSCEKDNDEFDIFVSFIERILRNLLPQELIAALSSEDEEEIQARIYELNEKLPIIAWNHPDKAPCTLSVSL